MKLLISLACAVILCALQHTLALNAGAAKFTLSGLVMVLSGGYLIGACFDFVLTILPIVLLYALLGELLPTWKRAGILRHLAYCYPAWTLYLILVQFTGFPFFGLNTQFLEYFSLSFFEGLYYFSSPWQAIAPSLGSGFLASIFCLAAYRKYDGSPGGEWFLALGAALPIWLGWLIPLSLSLNDIAWTHLPIE